jgi:hypothetical protein
VSITTGFSEEPTVSIYKAEDSTLQMVVADLSKTLLLCNHKIHVYSFEHINVFIALVAASFGSH